MTRDGTRFGWRVLATCMLLIGLAMTQSPGLLVADTKLDLAVAPLDFLARAAHLWDGEGAFGQLQNQAYGYLWPMGPFFALGFMLDVPGWVVQRLWMALVLCVAFVGTAKVARALGVRSDLACIAGGLAFALSPRMLTVVGPSSIEMWPSALAPWVLLPLISGSRSGSARRAAALSALAIAMVGGVNAAATLAALPLGALWILTRTTGPRRRTLLLCWPVFTLLGTLWWLVPLFLLGGYSPPFLDYIESAANTTFPTTLFDALRGTSNWVPYVDIGSRAGNDLLRQTHVVTNSAVVMALGLAGLTLRRNPHRGFLLSGLVVGLFLVTMGHLGQVQGWFAPGLRELLDGPLAPLRNVHKFDPVIRLPMVVGLAFVLDELVERGARAEVEENRTTTSDRLNARLLVGVCILAVCGASLPAALGRISPAGGFADIPDYWASTADWLGEEQDEGVALLVPGSSFGTYVWGSPRDEPFQSLAVKPWAVRNAVPLAPPGNIRMLDAVESRMSQGRGGTGLTALLIRAGVSHVVVRNDLTRTADIPDPVLVHQALEDSPDLVRVETFGPDIGGAPRIEGDLGKAMVNGGWQDEYPAIEIYEVRHDVSHVTTTADPTVVVGGPEDLGDLAELGVIGQAPVRLAADEDGSAASASVVLTDGLRAVERNFGRLHDATSETRTAGEDRDLPSRSPDYELADPGRWSTRAQLVGARQVSASSSQADANALGAIQPGAMPYAALDGDLETSWVSGPGSVLGHWWQVELTEPRNLGRTAITVGGQGREVLQVITDDWLSPLLTFEAGDTRRVSIPGPTRVLRIEDQSGRTDNRLVVAEVSSSALDVNRVLVMPELPEGAGEPSAVVMRRVGDDRTGCARVDDIVRCRQGQARAAEEPSGFTRWFALAQPMTATPSIRVSANPGSDWDDYLFADQPVSALSSSTATSDQRSRALSAIDGTVATTWIAALDDPQPELRLAWLGRRTITGLALGVEPGTAARIPQSLQLTWPGGTRAVTLGSEGTARFRAIRTSQLTLKVIEAEPATDIAFDGSTSLVPVGISELRVTGLSFVPVTLPGDERTTPCGAGPGVRVNGVGYETRVTAVPAELFAGGSGTAELCGVERIKLDAGPNEVEVAAATAFVVDSVVLGGSAEVSGVGTVDSQFVTPTEITMGVPGAGSLVTNMNTNRGWTAETDTGSATAGVYDGWRQGWEVDEDADVLVATFGPDTTYRVGLLAGAASLLLLLLLTVRGRRGRPQEEQEPLRSRRASPALVMLLAVVTGAALAGPVGTGVAAVVAVLGALVHRRAPVTGSMWLCGLLLAPAAVAYVLRPWGDSEGWAGSWGWPHYFVLAACAAVLGALATDSSRRQRSEMREVGSSTTR